jgi:pimeloyl-ACP methyl ester carboxylesterase
MAHMTRLQDVFSLTKFFFWSLLFCLLTVPVYGFSEEFNTHFSDPSYWEPNDNSGTIEFSSNGIRLLRSIQPTTSFPYVKSIKDIFPTTGSFVTDISFNYINTGNFGDGIVLYKNAPQNGVSDFSNGEVLFKVWQDSPIGLRVVSHVCPQNNPSCNHLKPNLFFKTLGTNYNNHILRVTYSTEEQYQVFVDNLAIPIFTSTTNQVRPAGIWFGNPVKTNTADYWSSFEIDYIRVTTGGPVVVDKKPVIVLPGMGGSWDFDAILDGSGGSNWSIPDFVNVYDNLIESLENDGYVLDDDLFVFAYDWRKELDSLADQLDEYINNLVSNGKLGPSEKMDLVGHSMGGLVARSYGQKYGVDKINKIVTAGSPHLGVADTYAIWEGATVVDRPWWQKAAIELLVRLGRNPGENKVEAVRRLTPSVKDLLPIYDFFLLDGLLRPWGSLTQKNEYLDSIRDVSTIDTVTRAVVGEGETTKKTINGIVRDFRDVMAGKWEDGKVMSFNFDDGDGTIPLESAGGDFSEKEMVATDHGGVISDSDSIAKIFTLLGLDTDKVVSNTTIDWRDSVLVAILRSPGTLEVCEGVVCNANLGWYFPSHKLFFLPGFSGQDVSIGVMEAGLGTYDLHIGKLTADSEKWRKIEGNLREVSQKDSYKLSGGKKEIKIGQEGKTPSNGVTSMADKLDALKPDWDTNNEIDKVMDDSLSILDRLKAARKIRYSLMGVVREAHLVQEHEVIETSLRVWINLDRLMENVLGGSVYIKTNQVNRHKQSLPLYRQEVEDKLQSSINFYAGEFLKEANRQQNLAELLSEGQETLVLDKLHSARYLYILSLDLRN